MSAKWNWSLYCNVNKPTFDEDAKSWIPSVAVFSRRDLACKFNSSETAKTISFKKKKEFKKMRWVTLGQFVYLLLQKSPLGERCFFRLSLPENNSFRTFLSYWVQQETDSQVLLVDEINKHQRGMTWHSQSLGTMHVRASHTDQTDPRFKQTFHFPATCHDA